MSPANFTEVADALSALSDHQLDVASRTADDRDAQPDDTRDRLRQLGQSSVGAAVSEALIALNAAPVVPVDCDTLEATADPFAGFGDALQHYAVNHHHGVGLLLGTHQASTLVAVRGKPDSLAAWLADVGTEARTYQPEPDDHEHVTVTRSYRDPGPRSKVWWAPPKLYAGVRASAVALGRTALIGEGERIQVDRAGHGETGWLAWSVLHRDGQRLEFRNRRIADGVEALGSGVLPMAGTRSDGWSVSATGVPQASELLPGWLVSALGGRWVKV